jgi:hypothetical protein
MHYDPWNTPKNVFGIFTSRSYKIFLSYTETQRGRECFFPGLQCQNVLQMRLDWTQQGNLPEEANVFQVQAAGTQRDNLPPAVGN